MGFLFIRLNITTVKLTPEDTQNLLSPLANDPFKLSSHYQFLKNNKLNRFFCSTIERLLGFKQLSKLYIQNKDISPADGFSKQVLSELNISSKVHGTKNVPLQGPLLIVANHPFGGLEALLLISTLATIRLDFKLMANIFLKNITPLAPILFGVNPFKDSFAKTTNHIAMRKIQQHLINEHCLITFPAGNVSYFHLSKRQICDAEWNEQIAHLARSTNANVLPIYIKGKNSWMFYLLGPHLHALLYSRELLNKRNLTIEINIGEVISNEKISQVDSNINLIQLFRARTDQLANI